MTEEELARALKVTVNELAEEKSKKGIFEKIATVTALLSAVAAVSGAAISINASLKAVEQQATIEATQRTIENRQITLDKRQKLIDENTRIGRLDSTVGWFCESIPTDEDKVWETYKACLTLKEVTNSIKDDEKRYECADSYVPCNKNVNWHNKQKQPDA